MILNTQIRGEQIADDTISGSHLIAKNSPTGGYLLSWDGTEEKFSWDEPNSLVVNEIPSGSINGSNKVFTLENEPLSDTERVSLNGLLQEPGSGKDYTISGDTITFSLAPNTGDVLLVSYLMGEAIGGSSGGANVPYGYSMGGAIEGNDSISTINRIMFPFDSGTSTVVGNLSMGMRSSAGCNSSEYGFVLGGYSGTYRSNIERILFPFDSGTASHLGNLRSAIVNNSACNSSMHGFSICGELYGGFKSAIDRITFPFDFGVSTHVGNAGTRHHVAGCNCSTYGYSSGGWDGSVCTSTVYRILFPFDSGAASHTGNITVAGMVTAGCNSSNHGYVLARFSWPSYSTYSLIDRIVFPFDSGIASHVGNLTRAYRVTFGCNSSTYGFTLGGGSYSLGTYFSNVERITFPFDSGTAASVGVLSSAINYTRSVDGTDFVNLFV